MGLEDVPRCQHVKVNGVQCGSPALRRKRRCYFHEGVRAEGARLRANPYAGRPFELPVLEDANAVQLALMQVLQLLGRGQMDPKIAGLMLYGLQTASGNLKNTKFEAEKVTDVVIDCNTVEQTCINGPQWFADEFAELEELEQEEAERVEAEQELAEPTETEEEAEQLEEVETDGLAEADAEEVLAEIVREPVAAQPVVEVDDEAARALVARESIRPKSARAAQRKRPGMRNLEDQPDSLAKILLQRMGLPLVPEEGRVEAG